MSELTQCNFCSLEGYKRAAKQKGRRIVLLPASKKDKYFLGGLDVFEIPREVTPSEFKEWKPEARQKFWISWFMQLTDHCAC